MRIIQVVYPEDMKQRFQDYIFKSYEEVATYLAIGEEATVAVAEVGEHLTLLAGYGKIKRVDATTYSYPSCLQPDY